MEQVGDEHIEEPAVVEIVKFFEEKLPKSANREEPYTIFRVPKLIRQANDKGFEPQLLSIGPFHHGKEGLKPMEEKKLQYLQAILSRNKTVGLKDYVKEIKKLKVEAKLCYSESIGLEGDDSEFEKMMLLDGCFLVEMFLRIGALNKETWPQFLSKEMWFTHFANHDMLLLENQIPFFVLERIFSLAAPQIVPVLSIKDLVLFCFGIYHSVLLNDKKKEKESYHHLLDLFHHHCLPQQEADPDTGEQFHQNLENMPVSTRVEEQSPPNPEVRIEGMPVEEHSRPEVRRSEVTPLEEPLLPQARSGLYTPFEGSSTVRRGAVKPREEFSPNREVRFEGTPVEEHSLPGERRREVTPLEEPLHPQDRMAVYKPSDCSSIASSIVPTGAMKQRGVYGPHGDSNTATRDATKPHNGSTEQEQPDEKKILPFELPSVEELQDAGIKFKRKEEKPGSFLGIKFKRVEEKPGSFLEIEFPEKWAVLKGPVMKIPYLYCSDNMQFIFRNLIAYEQCNPKVGTFFTGYAWFMDDLINTAKDVRILRRARILEHGLGSDEEAAKHFNQLTKGVCCDPETLHLYSQRMQIIKYCENSWNIARGNLVREYFYSPWAAVSLAGALLALALTIFNTGLSIYSTFYA